MWMKNYTMLSTTAEHAIRALAELASLRPGEAIHGRQLAHKADIPANYLSKILWTLGHAGLIDATRGSGGGYRLRRDPAGIRLAEVINLFDRPKWRAHCFLSCSRECSDADACLAHQSWLEVREAYQRFLESTTIAQISNPSPVQPAQNRKAGRSGAVRPAGGNS
jgi:Rrf2 family protein